MLNVLFVAARSSLYGASQAFLAQLPFLRRHGIEPSVVTTRSGSFADAIRLMDVRVMTETSLKSPRALSTRLFGNRYLRPVIAQARQQKIDLVSTTSLSASPAARRIARQLSVPWVAHVRNRYDGKRAKKLLQSYGVAKADFVIPVSQSAWETAKASITGAPPPHAVIPDGIVMPVGYYKKEDARRHLGLPTDALVAGFVGSIAPLKGTLDAARIVAQIDGLQLVVLGSGSGEYASLVREQPKTHFPGFRIDARALLPAFDVLLHPSRTEAYPLAPLEAMAAGVPVIASRVGGTPEALGDAAILLEPRAWATWVDAVRALLSDPKHRHSLQTRGRARAEQRSGAQAAELTARTYHQICRRTPNAHFSEQRP